MTLRPTDIAVYSPAEVDIVWSDGQRRRYTIGELREHCPCASCREKRKAAPPPTGALPVLSLEEAQPLKLLGMQPVGQYAYSVEFSDGHDTGIFTFEFLRELGQAVE